MTAGAAVLTACAGVMAALAFGHLWAGRHSSRPGAAVLAAALMASLAVPLMLRGPGSEPLDKARREAAVPDIAGPGGDTRVVMILLEGASLDLIAPAAAEGRLPNFERLLESRRLDAPGDDAADAAGPGLGRGRHRQAAVQERHPVGRHVLRRSGAPMPSRSCPTTAISHALVRFGFLRERVHESGDLAARPIWNLLGAQGVPVGVVNWPVTQPVGAVRGYLVSDRFARRYASVVDVENIGVIWPRDASPAAVAAATEARERAPGRRADGGRQGPAVVASPCAADQAHEQIAAALDARDASRFQAVRYECLDAVGHYFLRYAAPAAFGDVSDDELRRYGGVLAAQYTAVDAAARARDGDASAGRSPAGGLGVRHAADERRQAPARAHRRQPGAERHARARARRVSVRLRHRRPARAGCRAGRSWIWRRPSCTSSACRSAGTWTGLPARTSSRPPSARGGRSRTSPRTSDSGLGLGIRGSGLGTRDWGPGANRDSRPNLLHCQTLFNRGTRDRKERLRETPSSARLRSASRNASFLAESRIPLVAEPRLSVPNPDRRCPCPS